MYRLALSLLTVIALAGCKVEITVPAGGVVVTQSGSFRCEAGQRCTVDVYDTFFDETFEAVPASGYSFSRWVIKNRGLCGGNNTPCRLRTQSFAGFPALMNILESDAVFYLEPEFTASAPILYLLGGAQEQFYLGCITCPVLHFESICNVNGEYGSPFGIYSIWNASGDFGSPFSNFSPWNGFGQLPPAIYDTAGRYYGYLSINPLLSNRTTLAALVELTNLAATGRYDLPTLQRVLCE